MNTGRALCFLLLFTITIEAMLSPRLIPKFLPEAFEGLQKESHFLTPAGWENREEYFKFYHFNANPSKSVTTPDFMPGGLVHDSRPCPLHQRRSLVLVRRGCIGGLAKGLSATATGLSKSASRLQRFDKFFSTLTFREKLAWFAKKGVNGAKHTVIFAGKGVFFLGKMLRYGAIKTGRGAWIVMRGTWHGAKHTTKFAAKLAGLTILGIFLLPLAILRGTWEIAKFVGYKIPIHSWKYLGKGLEATGRGLQKAGNRMQAQSAARIAKKVPTPQ